MTVVSLLTKLVCCSCLLNFYMASVFIILYFVLVNHYNSVVYSLRSIIPLWMSVYIYIYIYFFFFILISFIHYLSSWAGIA
jgi:hypothetical protein